MALAGFGLAWLAALGLRALERRIRPSWVGLFALAVGTVQLADQGGIAHRLTLMEEGSILTSAPRLVESLKSAGPKGRTVDAPPLRIFPNDLYVSRPIPSPKGIEDSTLGLCGSLVPEYASVFGVGYMFELDYDLSLPRTVFDWTTLLYSAVSTGRPVVGNLLRAVGIDALIRSERGPDGRFEPRLYFTTHPLPPFRFVSRIVLQRDERRRFSLMLNEGFRPDTAYVRELRGGAPARLGSGRIVQLRDRASGLELLVEVTGEYPAFLLVNRLHEAACEGELDGRPIEVAETAVGFAGTLIPPGRHQLRLRPETRWVKIGAFMSILSLLVLAFVCSKPVTRRREP
jgi:hypothetical protein